MALLVSRDADCWSCAKPRAAGQRSKGLLDEKGMVSKGRITMDMKHREN